MLLPLTQFVTRDASGEFTEQLIGVNPFLIAHVEPYREEGKTLMYVDGRDGPIIVAATVEEIVGAVNLLTQEEDEPCEPDDSNIE